MLIVLKNQKGLKSDNWYFPKRALGITSNILVDFLDEKVFKLRGGK